MVVGCTLLVPPSLLRHRLPDPVATHWRATSDVPDGSMPLWVTPVVATALWTVVVAVVAALWRRGLTARPAVRAWCVSILGGGGGFLVAVQLTIIHANLDRPTWQAAGVPTWGLLLAGLLGGLAGLPGLAAKRRSRTTR
ncbi:hypothetical protein NX801_06800 [Streptomyces sp. LP05-1]|uniref:DUF1648 domain-containing protein n=1 Tax=Streptomyces pyxinae TaxID=2970734 RepID=A0ABT2CDA9_9ACTN|nr:hypothetical protein [Streptomyces sp. LP05-1]MCS0635369.1 hypothetical protein [Streptomyces sp. LP05-1]